MLMWGQPPLRLRSGQALGCPTGRSPAALRVSMFLTEVLIAVCATVEERPFQGRVKLNKDCGLLAPEVVFMWATKTFPPGLKSGSFGARDAALKRRSSTSLRGPVMQIETFAGAVGELPGPRGEARRHCVQSEDVRDQSGLVLHDPRKRFRIERCPAHQRAIDFLLRHQSGSVVRFHRPSVENAQLGSELLAKHLGSFTSDDGMRLAAISGVAFLPVPMAHTGS